MSKPRELTEHAFILTGADEPESQTRYRQHYGLGRHLSGLSEHLEEARRLTILGLGLCFLPVAFVERDVADGKLHPVLRLGNEPKSDIFIVSNPNAPAHHARAILLDYLHQFKQS